MLRAFLATADILALLATAVFQALAVTLAPLVFLATVVIAVS